MMGRVMRPLAMAHLELLTEALGDDIYLPADAMEFAALEIVSVICAQQRPTLDIGIPETEEETAAFVLKCAGLEIENEIARYAEYVDACLHSQPRTTSRRSGGASADLNAPTSHIIATQILRQINGITFDDLFFSWPVSQAYWLFWSLREQTGEFSNIAETDEPIVLTEEDIAREAREEKLMREIAFRRQKAMEGIVCPEMIAEAENEAIRLTNLLTAGRLTDELKEVE